MFPCRAGHCLRYAGISLLCTLPVSHVLAEEAGRTVINPLLTLGKLAIALLVVLAVFWLFARVMRHFQGFQGGLHNGLKIMAALPVGQREKVIVIQAGDKQLVLGVTSTQINTLAELDTPLKVTVSSSNQGDFKQKLNAALKRQVPAE